MKISVIVFIFTVTLFFIGSQFGSQFKVMAGGAGPGKAVLEASPDKGMRLSEKTIVILGLKYQILKTSPVFALSAHAVVYHQADVGVYRLRNGWFKLIDVQIVKKSKSEVFLKSQELRSGDQVVIEGVSLLRITELDITSGGGNHD